MQDPSNSKALTAYLTKLKSAVNQGRLNGTLDLGASSILNDLVDNMRRDIRSVKSPKKFIQQIDDVLSTLGKNFAQKFSDENKKIKFWRQNSHWGALYQTIEEDANQSLNRKNQAQAVVERKRRNNLNFDM